MEKSIESAEDIVPITNLPDREVENKEDSHKREVESNLPDREVENKEDFPSILPPKEISTATDRDDHIHRKHHSEIVSNEIKKDGKEIKKDGKEIKKDGKEIKYKYRNRHHSSDMKRIEISFGSKRDHQWKEYIEGKNSIHVDGEAGAAIHMYRDRTYTFKVRQSSVEDLYEHDFFLTKSPIGSLNGTSHEPLPDTFEPIAQGSGTVVLSRKFPKVFYYQCSKHSFEGGLCIVHDN